MWCRVDGSVVYRYETLHHTLESHNLDTHHCENFKLYLLFINFWLQPQCALWKLNVYVMLTDSLWSMATVILQQMVQTF